ncbi:hypothetical protein EV127DRAFT_434541 [Xylaria flabelliformis]|nr:hypothetical protein EV127DRAFT_434541 [Xylaria flabelliformis]
MTLSASMIHQMMRLKKYTLALPVLVVEISTWIRFNMPFVAKTKRPTSTTHASGMSYNSTVTMTLSTAFLIMAVMIWMKVSREKW